MKILYVASIGGFFPFFKSLVKKMIDEGNIVDFAANFSESKLPKYYDDWGCKSYDLSIERSPIKKGNLGVIKQIKKIVINGNYDIVHCHTPVAAVCTRFACKGLRKKGLKVFYTAHGFHFYDGAPLKNWLLYYPIEWLCSWYTDVLITINKEDYKRALEKFHAKKVIYVPGVGVDTEKFAPRQSGRDRIRTELNLKDSDIMLLSVGELNENKNHSSVIKAIINMNLIYVIVGKGEKEKDLRSLASKCGVDVRLVGFRNDVADFYDAADVYVLPSICEGLNVSLMEAMASGLAVACGRIRDNTDLIKEDRVLFESLDKEEIKLSIINAIENREKLSQQNLKLIKEYDLIAIHNLTSEIYTCGYEHLHELLKKQAVRNEIGVPLDAILLISVGELSVRKNHKMVVQALQKLPNNFWYVIVGKGNLQDELQEKDRTGHLKLLGFRTDIVELLHASDIFVFPSLQEGLPVALMEALAAGLPCVASRIRGNSDLLEDEFMFTLSNSDNVTNAIKTVLGQNREEVVIQNKRKITGFDSNIISQEMRKIYGLF